MTRRASALDWRAGGWALAAGGLLAVVVFIGLVRNASRQAAGRLGDGKDPASYGFVLDPTRVPLGKLVASGVGRDAIPALRDPEPLTASEVDALNERHRGKYLVPDDRVIGVTIGQESRAYPLRVLNWHEVVNDHLGGVPIAVAYHPLCDSVVVFDRRAADGEVLEFGVSGLLYQSHHLLFDRQSQRQPSLWSPLLAEAIVGPALGAKLRLLPCSVATWARWRQTFPGTTVPRPEIDRLSRYERNPYGPYLLGNKPRFPVDPLPPAGERPTMGRVLISLQGDRFDILDLDGGDRSPVPGLTIWDETDSPPTVLADPAASSGVVYTRWFAWYALHADSPRPASR